VNSVKALLLVDIQNDFVSGGNLAVPGGDAIVPVVNKLLDLPWDLIVATKDWHPADHGSFAENHEEKNPGEIIDLEGLDQILWPVHCVQESLGSEFVEGFRSDKADKVFYKGTDPKIDSYSAFFDNAKRKSTGLGEYLKSKGVDELYVVGLATDYCVLFSVLDALELGFKVTVIEDACRGIDLKAGDVERAFQKMQEVGADVVGSRVLI